MSRVWFALVLIVLVQPPLMATSEIGDLKFSQSLDSSLAEAQVSQKLIVIDFYTDW